MQTFSPTIPIHAQTPTNYINQQTDNPTETSAQTQKSESDNTIHKMTINKSKKKIKDNKKKRK